MTAALKDAIRREKWIVVTGWRPHWMFGRWDLKFLEQDSDKTLWREGNIHIMGRKGIWEDKPELARFLKNMKLTSRQLSDLMLAVEKADDDVADVAGRWMTAHPEVVSAWIPE
jgi:glycine betaine/proline transport system substrate-binding protein